MSGQVGWGILAWVVGIAFFLPVLWMVLTAFKPESAAQTWPPKFVFSPTLAQFRLVFSGWGPYVTHSLIATTVSTVLVQTEKSGKVTPVKITSARLSYTDGERKARFEGGVQAQGAELTITSRTMDVFLQPRDQATTNQSLTGTGKIDRILAEEQVVITQPGRKALGDRLLYTTDDDKFVMTGSSPSIFDAEHGKITGVSLTLFRHDGRVLVEGNNTSPTVTQTRVAR
jgi:lipopolysaccharide export system protein LptA